MPTARITELLANDTLARLERLRLEMGKRFTNRSQGEHLRGRGGNSIEFADFRNYSPGDDLRFLDWNIFARLRRPYTKLYRMEEEQHLVIVVDQSASMDFEGKDLQARRLAAAFAVMGLRGGERVSIHWTGQGSGVDYFRPARGAGSLRSALAYCEGLIAGGDEPLDRAVARILAHHRGKGIVLLLSDFLNDADFRQAFSRWFNAGLAVNAVQILAPVELDPEVSGDLRFIDCETAEQLDVSGVGDLLDLYHEHRRRFTARLERLAVARAGRFLQVTSAESLETIVFDRMRRAGWLR